MPMYSWRCKKTGLEVEILRSFDEYLDPPKEEELAEEERGKERDWEKFLPSPPEYKKNPYWGKKGYWVILFALIGLSFFSQGCEDSGVRLHSLAKSNFGNKICYTVDEPTYLEGRYCIFYIGGK